jgi:hypothetical protein
VRTQRIEVDGEAAGGAGPGDAGAGDRVHGHAGTGDTSELRELLALLALAVGSVVLGVSAWGCVHWLWRLAWD